MSTFQNPQFGDAAAAGRLIEQILGMKPLGLDEAIEKAGNRRFRLLIEPKTTGNEQEGFGVDASVGFGVPTEDGRRTLWVYRKPTSRIRDVPSARFCENTSAEEQGRLNNAASG
jgi:hypothetical protein